MDGEGAVGDGKGGSVKRKRVKKSVGGKRKREMVP